MKSRLMNAGFSLSDSWSVGFGLGYLPWAPGTWGSLLGLPLAYLLMDLGYWKWLVLLLLIVLSVWSAYLTMRRIHQHDPKEIVCDEVVGLMLVLLWVHPQGLFAWGACFILFRLFDIIKPWPISWVDNNLKTAWGVVFDDLLAGVGAVFIYELLSVMNFYN